MKICRNHSSTGLIQVVMIFIECQRRLTHCQDEDKQESFLYLEDAGHDDIFRLFSNHKDEDKQESFLYWVDTGRNVIFRMSSKGGPIVNIKKSSNHSSNGMMQVMMIFTKCQRKVDSSSR